MSNFGRSAMVSLFILLTFLVPCHGKKNRQRKKCAVNKDVKFPPVMQVHVNGSEELHWSVDGMENKSLSPWTYSHEKSDNSFPSIIKEAKCDVHCVDLKGNVDLGLNPVSIKQEILVLHQEMKGCKPRFVLKIRVISVGCTCVPARRTIRGG